MDREHYPLALFVFLVLLSALSILGPALPGELVARLPQLGASLALLGVHAFLHIRGLRGRAGLYHGAQSVLITAIALFAGTASPVITLTAWMCGEAVATAPTRRSRLIAGVWHGALGLGLILTLEGGDTAVEWILAAAPTVIVVVVIVLLYVREARARESAQELARELADANRRIAAYAAESAARSREEERRRVARDLHDTLAQGLSGVILQMQAAQAHLDEGRRGQAGAILDTCLEQARRTLRESRSAIGDLRRADAAALSVGLVEELQRLAGALTEQYARPVELSTGNSGNAALPAPVMAEITAILREAVHNSMRHADCREVKISLLQRADSLRLDVGDDGCGFDPQELPEEGHYGLRGMRERAERLGAALSITGQAGAGTRVTLELPLPVTSGASNG